MESKVDNQMEGVVDLTLHHATLPNEIADLEHPEGGEALLPNDVQKTYPAA